LVGFMSRGVGFRNRANIRNRRVRPLRAISASGRDSAWTADGPGGA
jgi:hypothetical protein